MAEPVVWTLKGFCSQFQFVHQKMHDHAFAWVLGAGASRSSGIPTGGALVDAWLRELHLRLDKDGLPFEQWATEQNLGIKGFRLAEAAAFYPRIYERRFREHPDEGYAYLEELMAGKDPSPGYSILAKTMESTRHRVVVTTNFDNLVADALAIYTDTYPFVVGHEALTGFVRAAMRRPLVCKIHRDLLLGPKNDPRSLRRLHDAWAVALRSLLAQYTPIFVGYGGNDDSLMDLLESLDPGDIKGQMVWCYYEKEEPSTRIKDLVVQHRGVLVPVPDFDLFMILLGSVLGIEPLDAVIEERARKRTANYRERILSIDTAGHPDVAAALSSTLERAGGWWAWELRAQRETDREKREKIYIQGIQKFPKSYELHNSFAAFLAYGRDMPEDAERMFRKAHELAPNDVESLIGLAKLLMGARKDAAQAEQFFQQALEADPESPRAMVEYAKFIAMHRKNPEEAERLINKAIQAAPTNAFAQMIAGNAMASALNKIDLAEELLRRSVKLSPRSAQCVHNLAAFLTERGRNSIEAEALFRKASELDPKNEFLHANYAEFLLTQRRIPEARAMIQRTWKLGVADSHIAASLILYGALADRIERRDDSRSLGRLKGVFDVSFVRRDFNYVGLHGFARKEIEAGELDLYLALIEAVADVGGVAGLDRFERWRSIEAVPPSWS